MRYAGGLGWPRLSGKTGEFSAGSMATRAGFRITHWQSRPSFAVYSGWTWRKTAFILPILKPCLFWIDNSSHSMGGVISDYQFIGIYFYTFILQYITHGFSGLYFYRLISIQFILVVFRPKNGSFRTNRSNGIIN